MSYNGRIKASNHSESLGNGWVEVREKKFRQLWQLRSTVFVILKHIEANVRTWTIAFYGIIVCYGMNETHI